VGTVRSSLIQDQRPSSCLALRRCTEGRGSREPDVDEEDVNVVRGRLGDRCFAVIALWCVTRVYSELMRCLWVWGERGTEASSWLSGCEVWVGCVKVHR
jgi:hypothetical protein